MLIESNSNLTTRFAIQSQNSALSFRMRGTHSIAQRAKGKAVERMAEM
jgi:hypothetical protein